MGVFLHQLKTNNSRRQYIPNTSSDATEWLIFYLQSFSPDVFNSVCHKLGFIMPKKLNVVEAAAMWTESNVPGCQSRIILRHLPAGLRYNVQVAEAKICNIILPLFKVINPTYVSI